ncbi:putative Ig domain-containing protein [Rhizobium sp. MHM7A]|uniref:putative Ig domain-containing protein n=1 Tax=Rhizobium sp. MHM7A TaxID=2583233 RepID=UPI0011060CFF|nr:putative Ig domain-containing protein [Rhizobium sp. MHM7A]TLX17111.1 hypothetical protein FFR93_07310 [Rhizobium sp. MHM7A]
MFKKLLTSFLIAAHLVNPAFAFDAGSGSYFFRYKSNVSQADVVPEPQTKDITAYYIGGAGKIFSEKLPMKPQWADDSWRITKGNLPSGLSFDPATLTFHGTPETVEMNVEVELSGYDASNQEVASAVARFNIYQLPDREVKVDFYNHKGQYSSHALALPAGVVIDGDPKLISPLPKGVTFNARYFEGIPEEVGDFPVLAIGYDFTGEAIIAFTGWYRVEAGPTFAQIPDDLRSLVQNSYFGCTYAAECAVWYKQMVPSVGRAIKDFSKIRYYVETQDGSALPGTLNYANDPFKRELNGYVFNAFEQAVVRYKAVDVDNTIGYSNWFKIGSLGPTSACIPYGSATSITLSGVVGYDLLNNSYRIPSGLDSAAKVYSVKSGTLPDGISLNPDTGILSGKPAVLGDKKGVMVEINYPGRPDATPTTCGPFDFLISPAQLSLDASGGKAQYRVGEALSIQLSPNGAAVEPWSIALAPGAVLPSGVSFDADTGLLSGMVDQAGTFSANFVLTNGDGKTYARGVTFSGNANVDIKDVVARASIKRYDVSNELLKIDYDPSTIIGPGSETLTVVNGPLPDGIRLNSGALVLEGGTRIAKGPYGPFRLKLTDSTGMSDETNDFWIDVLERDPLTRGETADPVSFAVNLQSSPQKPFAVEQAPLAKGVLPLTYTLIPGTLPDGLSFNEDDGTISGLPKKKETVSGYTVRIDEISADNLRETSDPFSIEIVDPPEIPQKTLPILKGNVGGPAIYSQSPMATLISIRNYLVGYENAVVFDDAQPAVPGLNFAQDTGMISGVPSAEFSGSVEVTYHDAASRSGKLFVPVSIYPYPALTSTAASYELPRLAQASEFDIRVFPANTGFYAGVTYALAPTSDPLPTDLALLNGMIVGATKAPRDSVLNLIVRGTSVANGLFVDHPVSIKIVAERPMLLDIQPDDKLLMFIDEQTGKLVSRQWFTAPQPTGSFVGPVKWSLQQQPSWMSIDTNGQINGTPPGLGEWPVKVVATDQENRSASDLVTVKVTLSGLVKLSPGGEALQVRQGETFRTQPQTVTNVVRPFEWVENAPETLALNTANGVFEGRLDDAGIYRFSLDVYDADTRKAGTPANFTVEAVPRVTIPNAVSVKNGKQYDPEGAIEISFAAAENILKRATYAVTGDVPGTLYYKFYDDDDPSKLAYYVREEANGSITTIRQGANETVEFVEAAYLQPDHMIFDTLALTLKGIPSRAGVFQIGLAVSDDYQRTAYKVDPSDPTREEYNFDKTDMSTVLVADADQLEISNSATSEALYQYTSQPTLKTTVKNTAYGKGIISWNPISGTLPTKVVRSPTGAALGYAGYPSVQGTFDGIAWEAQDWAGRKINSEPVTFTVGPRLPLQLVASSSVPRPMIVFDQDADLRVSAKNLANGVKIALNDWTITGADKLPPGVTYTLTTDGFHFQGTSDKIGRYSGITITGTDSLGATASLPLIFDVIPDPEAIVLNVFDIKTKPGFPIEMRPPFASAALSTANTYGTVRFYSNDLPSIAGINLDPSTGYLTGSLSQPNRLTFDLFVTDETNRVTSKPVTAEVIPNLRLIVPTQVEAEQGLPVNIPVATDYVLGKVTYSKGAGNWPVGFVVNPDTGAITSSYVDPATGKTTTDVIANAGTYPDLTIIGSDAFGNFTDQQSSNKFALVVKPTLAAPDIADQVKTIFGTEGTTITAWKPKAASGWASGVVEKVSRKAWMYSGTDYSASHDLSQYGLTFNTATGEISGTPTAEFIIRDFVITVTSQQGDVDSTAPFWIGVAPQGSITATAGQQTENKVRVAGTLNGIAPQFDNVIGNLTYSKVSGNSSFGVESGTGKLLALTATSGWAVGTYPVVIQVSDEFGRTAQLTQTVKVIGALTITVEGAITLDRAITYNNVYTPVLANLVGASSYVVTGLPVGLTFDPTTGALSGKVSDQYLDTDKFPVTFTVTDAYDGASKSGSTIIGFGTAKQYWRILDRVTNPGYYDASKGAYVNGGFDTTVWGTADGTTPTKIRGAIPSNWYPSDAVWSISGTTYDTTHMTRDTVGFWRAYKFAVPTVITSVGLHYINTWTTANTQFRSPVVQSSDDGVTWKDEFSGYSSQVGLDWVIKR